MQRYPIRQQRQMQVPMQQVPVRQQQVPVLRQQVPVRQQQVPVQQRQVFMQQPVIYKQQDELQRRRYDNYRMRNQIQNNKIIMYQKNQLNNVDNNMRKLNDEEVNTLKKYSNNQFTKDHINNLVKLRKDDEDCYKLKNQPYKLITKDREDYKKPIQNQKDLEIKVEKVTDKEIEQKYKTSIADREYANNQLQTIFTNEKKKEYTELFENINKDKMKDLEEKSNKEEINDQVELKNTNSEYYKKVTQEITKEKSKVDSIIDFVKNNNL